MTMPVALPSPAPVATAAPAGRGRNAAPSDGRDLATMVEDLVKAIEDDRTARSGEAPAGTDTGAVVDGAAAQPADGSTAVPADAATTAAAEAGAAAALAAALRLVSDASTTPAHAVHVPAAPATDGVGALDVTAPVEAEPTTAAPVVDGTGEVTSGDAELAIEGPDPADETDGPATGATGGAVDADDVDGVDRTAGDATGGGDADTAAALAPERIVDLPDAEVSPAGTSTAAVVDAADAAPDGADAAVARVDEVVAPVAEARTDAPAGEADLAGEPADAAADGVNRAVTTTATDVSTPRPADAAAAATATSPTSPTGAVDATSPTTAPTRAAAPAVPEQLVSVLAPLREGPDGTHRLAIHLRPGDLGEVQVEVLVRGNEISLHLRADAPGTTDLLRSTMHELRAELEANGFRPGDLDVGGYGPGASADDRTDAGTSGSTSGGTDSDAALDDVRTTTGLASAAGLDLRL